MAESTKLIRTLRLDDREIGKIIEQLAEADEGVEHNDRNSRRYRYHAKGCVIHLHSQAGGASASYLVPTRSLSDKGMSFLLGAFLYTGARCIAQLTTVHGTWEHVPAEVVRCDYVSQGVHDVEIRFLSSIDASEYCAEAIRRRALIVDHNKAIIKFTEMVLQRLNVDCDSAISGADAIPLALSNIYDFVIMDMDMPEMSGFDVVKQLRADGYSGTIVAATGVSREEDKRRCLGSGCNAMLEKPLQKDQLTSLLRSLCREPLRSTLAHDSTLVPLIDEFVMHLASEIREIESAYASGNTDALVTMCRDLKAEAGSFGFDPISTAAADVEQKLVTGTPIPDVRNNFNAMIDLCRQARGCSA